ASLSLDGAPVAGWDPVGWATAGAPASSSAVPNMIKRMEIPLLPQSSSAQPSSGARAVQLGRVLGFVLQQLRPDPDRARSAQSLEQEDGEAEADREHRGNEQQRDGGPVVAMSQARGEQQHDHQAGEQR